MRERIIYYAFILCLLILISCRQYILYQYFTDQLSDFTPNNGITHILFTRFKEPDMSRLLQPFINKKNTYIFIYNKGTDLPTGISDDITNIKVIQIPNLGWDAYAYFYHVINYYDNLPDYIYQLQASAQYLDYKYERVNNIINTDQKYYYGGDIITNDLNFSLDNWFASFNLNNTNLSTNVYVKSSISPLSKWLKSKIKTIPEHALAPNNEIYCSYYGMFKVHKSRILRYPLTFYKDIFSEIQVWQSEVNHYLERSWYALYGDKINE